MIKIALARDAYGVATWCNRSVRLLAGAGAVTMVSLLAAPLAAAADCEFDSPTQLTLLAEVEPKLNITADCSDPITAKAGLLLRTHSRRASRYPMAAR